MEADGSLTVLSVELDPDLVTNIVVQTARDEASAFVNTFSPLITTLLGCNNDLRVRIYLLSHALFHSLVTRYIRVMYNSHSNLDAVYHLTVFAAGCACLAVSAEGFDCSRWVSPWILHGQVQRQGANGVVGASAPASA